MNDKLKIKIPTVDELLGSGVHFGHQSKKWHPSMEKYIFEKTGGVHIFDLYKTSEELEKACKFLYETASKGGKIVFVGTKKQAKVLVENEAKRCGALYMTDKWVGGTITNFTIIKKNIDKLKDYLKKKDNNELLQYTKMERLLVDRDIAKLTRTYGGIMTLNSAIDAVFIVDIRHEKTALREAIRQGVPVVALVDTNSDPSGVSYVIPGNDDALKAIAVVTKALADAAEEGYLEFAKKQEKEKEVVIPSNEGIQLAESGTENKVDSRLRGNDSTGSGNDPAERGKQGSGNDKKAVPGDPVVIASEKVTAAAGSRAAGQSSEAKQMTEKPKRGRPKKS